MTWRDALEIGLVVIASLGGGGAIVLGLSNWLGRVWADSLAERQRLASERELANQRGRIDQALARFDAALEHRNLLLQRLADIELQGLRECWQRARECYVHVNGLRPVDSGTDEDLFRARWVGLADSHNALLSKVGEFEPFLEDPITDLLQKIRYIVALEMNQSQRERFTSRWWDQGTENQQKCERLVEELRLAVRARVAQFRKIAEGEDV
ncbi:MAG TPA: hypothetical protein VGD94_12355 [Vicinamibacterales bacterium]